MVAKKLLNLSFWIFCCVTVIVTCAFCVLYFFGRGLPAADSLLQYSPPAITRLYDSSGRMLSEYSFEKRTVVPFRQIPTLIKGAFLVAEDRDFYDHFGVSVGSLFRAIVENTVKNLWSKKPAGGSTITQQLSKNLFVGNERKVERKIKEAIMAFRIESTIPKDKILEVYLNQIYLGQGCYGVAEAAKFYFGKKLDDILPQEAAFIASLTSAPSVYSRSKDQSKILMKRNAVLYQMHESGYISKAEFSKALKMPIEIKGSRPHKRAQYFSECVKKIISNKITEEIFFKGGFSVITTLDRDIQKNAEAALNEGLDKFKLRHGPAAVEADGGMIVMDPKTGEVLALVGGVNYSNNQFDWVTQAKRQPGSTIKSFVYACAFEEGINEYDLVEDKPIKLRLSDGTIYSPKNYKGKVYGQTSVRDGLIYSRNLTTLNLAMAVGMNKIYKFFDRFNLVDGRHHISSVLGSVEIKLIDMVCAYCAFANSGYEIRPKFIKKIATRNNNFAPLVSKIQSANKKQTKVLDDEITTTIKSILKDTVKYGVAKKLNYLQDKYGIEIAGKTGTTNDSKDAWFVGFINDGKRELALGVVVGYRIPKSLGDQETGATVAIPIVDSFINKLFEK